VALRASSRPLLSFALLLLAALALGCTGDSNASPSVDSADQVRVTPTPEPSPTPWPIAGKVLTNMQATCSLGLTGAELKVRYGADIEGEAEITRVRLVVDSQVREDIDHLAERSYLRETTLSASANRMVQVELFVETRGATPTPRTAQLVRCPRTPDFPRT
jgi:hypothetical protein